jgi:hypothetical protein
MQMYAALQPMDGATELLSPGSSRQSCRNATLTPGSSRNTYCCCRQAIASFVPSRRRREGGRVADDHPPSTVRPNELLPATLNIHTILNVPYTGELAKIPPYQRRQNTMDRNPSRMQDHHIPSDPCPSRSPHPGLARRLARSTPGLKSLTLRHGSVAKW